MSIEMENPKTVLEKIDAASNYVAQMLLAHRSGDGQFFSEAHEKASGLLFDVVLQIEKEDILKRDQSNQ